jgi:Skp family chaperone for outer membrane proteins
MRTFIATAVLLCAGVSAHAQAPLSEKRDVVKQWIETRQTLARVQAAWAEERDLLQQSIATFEREIKAVDDTLAKTGDTRSETSKKKEAADADIRQMDDALAKTKGLVAALEGRLTALLKALPEPVAAKIQPFVNRIPKDPNDTKASLPERVQNLVGILNEVDKFNAAVTVESEIRKNPEGAEIQVRTLYLGLAQAYFTDTEGSYAGYGVPTADGWKWTENKELSPQIRKAIAVYESTAPVQFVELPVKVQ